MTPTLKFASEITVRQVLQCGSDAHIAAAAWVSTSAEEGMTMAQEDPQAVAGLINYLMKNRHGSPFEHGSLTVYAHAPIFVWREWHRHRIGFSYNEESARYKKLDPVFYIPPRSRPMLKVENWKPGRPKFLTLDEVLGKTDADDYYRTLIEDMARGYADDYPRYLRWLEKNLDPGLARDGLPVGIYSGCWVTCNPRSIMSFLSLRTHEPTAAAVSYPLYEIESAARKLEAVFAAHWPLTHAAFNINGRQAP